MTNYRVPEGDSIFDIAIKTYGSADRVIDVMLENGIQGLDFDFSGKALTIQFDETNLTQKDSPLIFEPAPTEITSWTVSDGQSIYDVALQIGYTLDAVIDLAQANGLSINNNLRSQQVLNYDVEKVLFPLAAKELRKKKYVINTSQPKTIPGVSFDNSFDNSFETE